jgi:hypothetical protein
MWLAQIVMKIAQYLITTEYTERQAFSPVVRIGPLPPHLQASVAPLWFRGGGQTRLRERGGGSQFGRRDKHSGTLGIV